ncbi:hypothetical protein DPQ70_13290 [Salmonella enterica]|nr:hypothetical protein [Salmonella enterica]
MPPFLLVVSGCLTGLILQSVICFSRLLRYKKPKNINLLVLLSLKLRICHFFRNYILLKNNHLLIIF